jgi:hypothetical protein
MEFVCSAVRLGRQSGKRGELACKPGSVPRTIPVRLGENPNQAGMVRGDGHSSGPTVTRRLKRPTQE